MKPQSSETYTIPSIKEFTPSDKYPLPDDNVEDYKHYLGEILNTDPIGHGDFSKVFECEFKTNEGKVLPAAMKLCGVSAKSEASLTPQGLENHQAQVRDSFEFEVTLLENVGGKHKNLPDYYGHGIAITANGEERFLLREYFEGSLYDGEFGSSTPNEVLSAMTQVSAGLMFLNEQGIIITDLDPANIMFRTDGSVVISDLNAPVSKSAELPYKGKVGVSDLYGAPELIGGLKSETVLQENASPASQVYSLAYIAYAMLGGDEPEEMGRVMNMPIEKTDAITDPIFEVLQKATAIEPSERYQNPDEFVKALQTALEKE